MGVRVVRWKGWQQRISNRCISNVYGYWPNGSAAYRKITACDRQKKSMQTVVQNTMQTWNVGKYRFRKRMVYKGSLNLSYYKLFSDQCNSYQYNFFVYQF